MSTLAEQVVEQLKNDMDNVYDAGYQKGKLEGGTDTGVGSREWWLEFTYKKERFEYFFANYHAYPSKANSISIGTPEIITEYGTHFDNMFFNNRGLQEIGGVLNLSKAKSAKDMFYLCTELIEVRFVPLSIPALHMNFGFSYNLSDESIQSIIEGLVDLTGKTTQTVIFHPDVEARMSEEQKAIITSKNWTLAVADA